MNTFEKKYFLFKSFVKIELSYVFTINTFSTAESCHGSVNYLIKIGDLSLVLNYFCPSSNSRQLIFNINAVVLIDIIFFKIYENGKMFT